MQYMFLIYTDPVLTPNIGQAMNDAYFAFNRMVKDAGVFLAGDALRPTTTATSVRVRGDKTETMDGPFAETKEALGGYYILDCKDLDEALHYAALIPGAKLGTVEVRPVVVFN
jgi:hypothetical protein